MQPVSYLDYIAWAEILVLGLIILFAVYGLSQCRLRLQASKQYTAPPQPVDGEFHWLRLPELQLLVFGLPLELLWEIAQFPLFTVWHEGDWGFILYGLAHCTLGDLLILLSTFWIVALLNRSRHWYLGNIGSRGALFTLLGLGYTIFSEIKNVRIEGTWGYTELMPVIPVIDVGGMPFMQWVLIPPLLLWLMRLYTRVLAVSPQT